MKHDSREVAEFLERIWLERDPERRILPDDTYLDVGGDSIGATICVHQVEERYGVRLEVDAFKDRKFSGEVTQIANSSRNSSALGSGTSQEATKFEVRIRVTTIAEKTMGYTCLLTRGGERIASGAMTIACVSKRPDQTMKAVPIPPEIASRFEVATSADD